MKDASATMGTILTPDVGGRDAVHVAVISVVAAQNLMPGWHVGFIGRRTLTDPTVGVDQNNTNIGIVDPFIASEVKKGQRFWLYLYPRTITSLRHNWTHPAFADAETGIYVTPAQKLASEKWLKDFARENNFGYNELISGISGAHKDLAHLTGEEDDDYYSIHKDGEYLHINGTDASGDIPTELWDHVEVVTGVKITNPPKYFSCSC